MDHGKKGILRMKKEFRFQGRIMSIKANQVQDDNNANIRNSRNRSECESEERSPLYCWPASLPVDYVPSEELIFVRISDISLEIVVIEDWTALLVDENTPINTR